MNTNLNVNPNATLKMNTTAVRHLHANKMIVTCHIRHIFMPIDQNIKKIYLQCNNLLNQNNEQPNENSLIVENKFNLISHRPCVDLVQN